MTTLTDTPAKAARLPRLGGHPELCVIAALGLATAGLGLAFRLPFSLPGADALNFLYIHYLIPLLAIAGWLLLCLKSGRERAIFYGVAYCAYATMLILHFNLKMWAPLINPVNLDPLLWRIDQALYPIVQGCFAIRRWLGTWAPGVDELYLFAFVAMFYVSFVTHALAGREQFRRVLLALLLLHGLGALMYVATPAVGPFIYEQGLNPVSAKAQAHMLGVYRALTAEGGGWLASHGTAAFLSPLGAMPSLHAGASTIMVILAARFRPWLLVAYGPIYVFILVEAVANRFHYVVDLPVGMALGIACVWAADRLARSAEQAAAGA